MNTSKTLRDAAAIEARLGARLAAALSERSEALPADITERLRFAREQALARAAQVARERRAAAAPAATAATAVGHQRGAVVLLGGSPSWWQRAAAVLPLALLATGLVLIGQRLDQEQTVATADIDAVLLADDLPPEAYEDAGFAEFLKQP